jgi:hypothetical protein
VQAEIVALQARPSGGLSGVQEFETSGTFVVPAGVSHLLVEMWGGGGFSADGFFNGRFVAGLFPGGGGAYARSVVAVTPGRTLTVQVGQIGAGNLSMSAIFDGATNLIFAGGGTNATSDGVNGTSGVGGQDDTRAMIHHPGPVGAAYIGNSNPASGFDGGGANGNPGLIRFPGFGYVLLIW